MSISTEPLRLASFDTLRPEHFLDLLRQEEEEWRRVLEWDFAQVREAMIYMLANQFLPGVALLAGDRCMGYIYYLIRDARTLLGGFYFIPEVRGSTWPRQALERLLGTLHRPAAPPVIEGQIVFPGPEESVGPFLVRNGFTFVERRFLRLDALAPRPQSPADSEVEVLLLSADVLEEMALVMHRSYRGHVDVQTSSLYASFQGCHHLLNQLYLKEGCGPVEPAATLAVRVAGEAAGAIVVSRISRKSFFVSQVFVDPRHQGRGLGRRLLLAALNALARLEPQAHLALTVTLTNQSAYEWYRRFGFEDVISHYAFVRPAPEPTADK
jgi:ribosomal protein S18 acetylase RimI-like enzyme